MNLILGLSNNTANSVPYRFETNKHILTIIVNHNLRKVTMLIKKLFNRNLSERYNTDKGT